VPVETFLGWLVVVRDDGHDGVDSKRDDLAGEVDRVCGAVVARVGDDGHPSAHRIDDGSKQLELLRVEDGRALARGSADDKPVASLGEELIGEFGGTRQVEPAVGSERSHHGRDHAAEARRGHREVSPSST
jgi:hypothetical protein